MQLLLTFVFLGVAATGINAGYSESCGHENGKFPFDVEKFAGLWYPVSVYHAKEVHDNMECFILNYTVIRTEKASKLRLFAEWGRNKKSKLELRAQELWWESKIDSSVSHAVWRSDKHPGWSGVVQHNIIATDYTTFAITKACHMVYSESEDNFRRRQLTLIISRTPEMDAQSRKLLETLAASSMADALKFQEVNNSNCWK